MLCALLSRPTVFRHVRLLALNLCSIGSWSTLQSLQPFLSCLEELYVAHNDLSDLPAEAHAVADGDGTSVIVVSGFEHLRILDITHCRLTSWKQGRLGGELCGLRYCYFSATFVNVQHFTIEYVLCAYSIILL
ncbi:hypothetical protein EON64_01170 [archaeon]|nr:MAG: hypothetical protein EON64_01170 [archaeon]